MHEVVDEDETAVFRVGGESHGGDDVGGAEPGGEEELVVKLALAGGEVHELDCNWLARRRRERSGVDGAEAAVAEADGEGVRGTAEEGV